MNKNILAILNPKKVTGLYIGHDTVDLVVLKSGLGGPKLIKFGQAAIYPNKPEHEGEIMTEAQTAGATPFQPIRLFSVLFPPLLQQYGPFREHQII